MILHGDCLDILPMLDADSFDSVEQSSKHLRVRFGRRFERFRIISRTPSDRRAPLNERAAVRRALAEMGWAR